MSELAGRRPIDIYPRREASLAGSVLDRAVDAMFRRRVRTFDAAPGRLFSLRVAAHARSVAELSAADLDAEIARTAAKLRRSPDAARGAHPRAYALIREIAGRRLGMRHYPVQIMAARAMDRGAVAEMRTGEGKTLTATLTAGLAGLAGRRVHLLTANDYLAERDADWMAPVYEGLGLTVGVVRAGMEPAERRRVYARDVVYAAGKEVAFDFLRDRVAMGARSGRLSLRLSAHLNGAGYILPGLDVALVDEADSVMIDEARTPLILSATPAEAAVEGEITRVADALATAMDEGRDFRLDRGSRQVELTVAAEARLDAEAERFPAGWRAWPIRQEALRTALAARHLHRRGEDYVVLDGKVQIVDEYTGRIMADRSWSSGLHQAVEAKEGCEITARRETQAQITFQRFFRRYRHLCGMTGTAAEAAGELWTVYERPVVRIPTRRRDRRRDLGTRVLRTAGRRWDAVAARAAEMVAAGRPVLIGTRTVAASEAASRALGAAGVRHVTLSATQEADEAEIVARAGRPGAVTVATNMAGRGTDIVLDPAAKAAGGLHVILTERHSARRIDRQLFGRCGRQGDPGSHEAILSFEDAILDEMPGLRRLRRFGRRPGAAEFDRAQRRAERRHARARALLLDFDEKMADSLAFTGTPE